MTTTSAAAAATTSSATTSVAPSTAASDPAHPRQPPPPPLPPPPPPSSVQEPSAAAAAIAAKRRLPSPARPSPSAAAARPSPRPRKRRKPSVPLFAPLISAVRAEIATSAHVLRTHGISPLTLFFPSLRGYYAHEPHLRRVLGPALRHLKLLTHKTVPLAWASFHNEHDCLHALLTLRLHHPDLLVSLHRPQQQQYHPASPQPDHHTRPDACARAFDKQLAAVHRKGGLGNTLLFRNLPLEVQIDEFQAVVQRLHADPRLSCTALRTRSALSKGRAGSNFWVVYAGVETSRVAFRAAFGKRVAFRCGKEVRLHPVVHDDSTDADESKRRDRAASLGVHKSRGRGAKETPVKQQQDSPVVHLERFLRSTQNKFVFLSPS